MPQAFAAYAGGKGVYLKHSLLIGGVLVYDIGRNYATGILCQIILARKIFF
jgi:hypothetical protein